MTAVRVVAITAALCCITVTAPAHADDISFLERVHAAGMPLTDEGALKLGNATCVDLGNGIAVSAILEANNPGAGGSVLTEAQNLELFNVAASELCGPSPTNPESHSDHQRRSHSLWPSTPMASVELSMLFRGRIDGP